MKEKKKKGFPVRTALTCIVHLRQLICLFSVCMLVGPITITTTIKPEDGLSCPGLAKGEENVNM